MIYLSCFGKRQGRAALIINYYRIMFSSKDFERCWFLYQSEGLPYNLSIEEFCLKQGVLVNELNKWYRDTHKRIYPIQVDGAPASEEKEESPEAQTPSKASVRIAVTICMSIPDNGA